MIKPKNGFLIAVFILSILFFFSSTAYCKRGCCSHHGGVCGGTCCDGTPLSAKCRGGSTYKTPSKKKYSNSSTNIVNKCNCNGEIIYTDQPCPCFQESEKQVEEVSGNLNAPYNRKNWSHWIDEDRDCQDTRAEILIRDNVGTIKYKRNKPCNVSWGKWVCPYTGKIFEKASDMDIDHIVPLSHAYKTGGANWSHNRKRGFANDPMNLIATEDNVNQAKGDKAPDQWRPPRRAFWSEYANKWMDIKSKYGLKISASEMKALSEMLNYK